MNLHKLPALWLATYIYFPNKLFAHHGVTWIAHWDPGYLTDNNLST